MPTLNLATDIDRASPLAPVLLAFADEVAERSGGELQIQVRFPGELVGAFETFEAVTTDIVDLALVTPIYYPLQLAGAGVLALPFVAASGADSSAALDAASRSGALDAAFAAMGLSSLAAGFHAPSVLTSPNPLGPNSFDGLKVQAAGLLATEVLPEVGASSVFLASVEIKAALQTGVIDASFGLPMRYIDAVDLQDAAPNIYYLPGNAGGLLPFSNLVANDTALNGLSAAERQIITDAAGESLSRAFGQAALDSHQSLIAPDSGLNAQELSGALLEQLRSASELARENVIEDIGQPAVNWLSALQDLPNPATSATSGADQLSGDGSANAIDGLAGDDQIDAQGGDDTLIGGTGDDNLIGGGGVDTAVFEGDQSGYTLSLSAGFATVSDRREDGQGTDTLTGIERLDFGIESAAFGGNPMNLDIFDDALSLTTEQFAEITELYIAYFNRAPDAIGLNFWASSFARGEVNLATMAELFFDQPETRSVYAASLSTDGYQITDVTAFVTAIFTNVLGREPDQGGLNFWAGVLERGEITTGAAIGSIIQGAKADAPANATQAEIADRALDQQYLSNATDIGLHFAIINGMSDTENADAVMSLLTRSSDSVSAAVAQSNQFLSEAQAASGGEFLMPLVGVIDDPFAI